MRRFSSSRAIAIIAAAFAALVLSAPFAEARSDSDAAKLSVRAAPGFAEGDPAAIVATHRRIVRAAARACGLSSSGRATLRERLVARACVEEAVDAAVAGASSEPLRVYAAALPAPRRYAPGERAARIALAESALGRSSAATREYASAKRMQRDGDVSRIAFVVRSMEPDDARAQDVAFSRLEAAVKQVCDVSPFRRVSLREWQVQRGCVAKTMEQAIANPRQAVLEGRYLRRRRG